MILQELPLEIIHDIFKRVHRDDLKNLLRISKKGHPSVKFLYFEEVTWAKKEKILWLKQHSTSMSVNNNRMQVFQ